MDWQKIWKLRAPLKTRVFLWLVLKNKILTWDILQRRNWQGPGRFPLFLESSESSNHIFVECHFTKEVWRATKCITGERELEWKHGRKSLGNLAGRPRGKEEHQSLPCFVLWAVWLTRNEALFQG